MNFMPREPSLVLDTIEDARKVVETEGWRNSLGDEKWFVKSNWIISLIDEVEASGEYPYNATVKKLAELRLGYPLKTDKEYATEGDNLSLLVYNAHKYRDHDILVKGGYIPFTKEVLEQVGEGGQVAFLQGKPLFNIAINGKEQKPDTGDLVVKIKNVGGVLYAMMPKSRTKCYRPNGQPCKIVKTSRKIAV
jgi:hypothetical protein